MESFCDIAVESPDLPVSTFHSRYRQQALPVVIRNATLDTSRGFRELTTLTALTEHYGEALVTLSSANAFCYGRRKMRVAQYLTDALGHHAEAAWDDAAAEAGFSAADNMYYWFGEHGTELSSLLTRYPLPRYASPPPLPMGTLGASAPPVKATEPALSFGVGPDGSGVPFHFHNDGFSEVLHGAKHWLLYAHKPPRFRENATSVAWLRHDYPLLHESERPYECVIGPGDLLYFPKGW